MTIQTSLFDSDSIWFVSRDFIIGTNFRGWWRNPIGLRFDLIPSKDIGDLPLCALFIFRSAQIKIVEIDENSKSLKEILAVYDFYPFRFTYAESARLEDQLLSVRVEYSKFADARENK